MSIKVIKVGGATALAFSSWLQVNNKGADHTADDGLFGHYADEPVKIDGQGQFTLRSIFNEGL